MKPVALPPNPVERFYEGGPRIARFRGIDGWSPTAPEDRVGSVTEAFGEPGVGLSVLADGEPLRDALAHDPEPFVGPEHAERFGADLGLLVKLLDSGAVALDSVGIGWLDDEHAAAGRIRPGDVIDPDPALRAVYDAGYERFTAAYPAIRAVSSIIPTQEGSHG